VGPADLPFLSSLGPPFGCLETATAARVPAFPSHSPRSRAERFAPENFTVESTGALAENYVRRIFRGCSRFVAERFDSKSLRKIPRPHCSTVSQWHLAIMSRSSRCMPWISFCMDSSSVIFCCDSLRQRSETGILLAKPTNKRRISSKVNPVRRALYNSKTVQHLQRITPLPASAFCGRENPYLFVVAQGGSPKANLVRDLRNRKSRHWRIVTHPRGVPELQNCSRRQVDCKAYRSRLRGLVQSCLWSELSPRCNNSNWPLRVIRFVYRRHCNCLGALVFACIGDT